MVNEVGVDVSDASGAQPSKPRAAAAVKFEILSGDLLTRLEQAVRRSPEIRDALESFDVMSAASRLSVCIAEHEQEVARPLNEQSTFLIERQGERIRALVAERDAALVKLVPLEEIAREFAKWRERHEKATLHQESTRELLEAMRGLYAESKEKIRAQAAELEAKRAEVEATRAELEALKRKLAGGASS